MPPITHCLPRTQKNRKPFAGHSRALAPDPAARGLDVFLHAPPAATPGGVLELTAEAIGFPVVTKPLDGNHGRGVGLDLRNGRAVRTGFKRALAHSLRRPRTIAPA